MENQLDPGFGRAEELVGTWRRFGPTGPVYQVLHIGLPATPGDRVVKVRIVETGEEIDYKLAELLCDPREG